MEKIGEWVERAMCVGEDPELWFPVELYEPRKETLSKETRKAIMICSMCPVIGDCLKYAKKTRQKHGIWGGVIIQPPRIREM